VFFSEYNSWRLIRALGCLSFLLLSSSSWYGCATVVSSFAHWGCLQFGSTWNEASVNTGGQLYCVNRCLPCSGMDAHEYKCWAAWFYVKEPHFSRMDMLFYICFSMVWVAHLSAFSLPCISGIDLVIWEVWEVILHCSFNLHPIWLLMLDVWVFLSVSSVRWLVMPFIYAVTRLFGFLLLS
jgi:hypothetical protein